MAAPAYERLLEIQGLDLQLIQLRHRIETHPARQAVADAEAEIATIGEAAQEVEGRRHELDRELKRLADEVELIEARRKDLDAKLYDGSVTASKELLAMQEEGATLLERQRRIEDDEIEIMERLEIVTTELDGVTAGRATVEQALAAAEAQLAEATIEIEAEIASATAKRAEVAEPAVPALLARYEELAATYGGVALSRFVDGRCDGCHMQLSAVAADQLRRAPDEAVVTCEECGRLLVR